MNKTLKNFIVFEGLDGAGQSTQAALLAKKLEKLGKKVLLTKEPTNNLIGGLIRGALTKEWKPSNHIIQLLYAADRGHHLEREIIPALNNGFTVISDRYLFSTLAFGSLDCDLDFLTNINSLYPMPEKAFYIRVSPATSIKRIKGNRFEMELFEQKEKLEQVSKTYNILLKKYPIIFPVNGEKSIDEVHHEVLGLLNV